MRNTSFDFSKETRSNKRAVFIRSCQPGIPLANVASNLRYAIRGQRLPRHAKRPRRWTVNFTMKKIEAVIDPAELEELEFHLVQAEIDGRLKFQRKTSTQR